MHNAAIETQRLRRTFDDKIALDGVDLRVERGEIFGYLGPNGAGKTTTIRVLLGLIRPTSGQAWVLGHDVTEDEPAIKAKIGVVLEDHGLYERLSAWDNLDYYGHIFHLPKAVLSGRIEALLYQVGLWDERDKEVGTFSRGMKQRLALARALLHEPELLFLDEPTAGLDPEATVMIRQLILALAHEGRRTIFLNSHNLDEVERTCSRIAILHRGRIQVMDTVENLQRRFSSPMVEVVVRDVAQAEQAQAVLSALPFVAGCQSEGTRVAVHLREKNAASQILDTLVKESIPVEEMRKVNRTLEDVYLSIVYAAEGDRG
ncbi:MAG: ABC transporter ATP-binding protein [Chloroflexota bacterium]|nr:ABC transporter ATP-binding protein [Chloroflexota bacterium]